MVFQVGTGNASGAFDGVISNASGVLALVKDGAGTQTLTGLNTYTGGTTIVGGVLLADTAAGSATGTGPVTVGPLGILGGTATVAGAVTVNGQLVPGDSGGTAILGVGNLSFGTGGVFAVDLNGTTAGTGYDQANVTGTVNLTRARLRLTVGSGLIVGNTFTILSNDGTKGVTGSSLVVSPLWPSITPCIPSPSITRAAMATMSC